MPSGAIQCVTVHAAKEVFDTQHAYVTTLCGGDAYLTGVEVLGRSLVGSGAGEPRLATVTADVSTKVRTRLRAQGWELVDVDPIENPSAKTVQLYPRFAKTFTKLRAFGLEWKIGRR